MRHTSNACSHEFRLTKDTIAGNASLESIKEPTRWQANRLVDKTVHMSANLVCTNCVDAKDAPNCSRSSVYVLAVS